MLNFLSNPGSKAIGNVKSYVPPGCSVGVLFAMSHCKANPQPSKFITQYYNRMFQYASDLHLEFYKPHELQKVLSLIQPKAPYLLLAGDIAPPSCAHLYPFLNQISSQFEQIFFIAGNHEYYTRQYVSKTETYMTEVETKLRELCQSFPNIHFLQNETYHFADQPISIFGATFWTPIASREKYVTEMIRDYSAIPGFSIDKSTTLWEESVQALTNELEKAPERQWVVLSHHIPRKDLVHPLYQGSLLNVAFASDIPVALHPSIRAWIYGHTHTASAYPPFYCNPLGYPGEHHTSAWQDRVLLLNLSDGPQKN